MVVCPVESVSSVGGRGVEASEREHGSGESQSQARAMRMRGGGGVGSDWEVFCASFFVVRGGDELCYSVGSVGCEELGGSYRVA